MSRRIGIQVTHIAEADGGEHPNKFVPLVSAHVRLYWPPLATEREVLDALTEGYLDAIGATRRKFEGTA